MVMLILFLFGIVGIDVVAITVIVGPPPRAK